MPIDYQAIADAGGIPKGESRKVLKGRRQRHAAKVITAVRAQCVERDGGCRVGIDGPWPDHIGSCDGVSEWAHMPQKRRSKTRGMEPEVRHTTADSLMLCTKHHDQLDGRRRPRLTITPLTELGCNGELRIT